MFDFDLARLYGTDTRSLKQSVRRNKERFPKDFMFQLNKKEWEEVITICDNLPEGIKYSPATPFAFTEHGVSMLASVLKTGRAVKMNIGIIRAFIALKQFALNYKELARQIRELQESDSSQNVHLERLYRALEELVAAKAREAKWEDRERIGFRK